MIRKTITLLNYRYQSVTFPISLSYNLIGPNPKTWEYQRTSPHTDRVGPPNFFFETLSHISAIFREGPLPVAVWGLINSRIFNLNNTPPPPPSPNGCVNNI